MRTEDRQQLLTGNLSASLNSWPPRRPNGRRGEKSVLPIGKTSQLAPRAGPLGLMPRPFEGPEEGAAGDAITCSFVYLFKSEITHNQ